MTPLRWPSLPALEAVPGRCCGAPVVRGTRLTADTIRGAFLSGWSIEECAKQYRRTTDQIENILRSVLHPDYRRFRAEAVRRAREARS